MTITLNGSEGITLDNGAADGAQVSLSSSGYSNWNLDNYSGRIRAYYGSTEYFTINSSGNVGIGTSSPTDSSAFGRALDISSSTGAGVYLRDSSSSTDYGLIGYYGESTHSLYLQARDSSGYIQFQTGGTTERARIDSSGNLLVGKTSNSPTSIGWYAQQDGTTVSTLAASTAGTNTYLVYSTGASAFRFYVGMEGKVYCTSTTITGISDQRLKENIRDLDDGLEKVMALQPRKFDWKEGKGKGIANDRGFIAQEFEQVFPDMIDEWLDPAPEGEEPYKAVNANLVPTLVKAIQEQQAIIESLKTRIETLENK